MLEELRRRERELPDDRYAPWSAAETFMRTGRARTAGQLLARQGRFPIAGRPCLEIGYGRLGWLAELLAWGLHEPDLCGIELDAQRAQEARSTLPLADLRVGDGAELPWSDGYFQLVVASTVFTSILDPGVRRTVAGEITRVLARDGALLWYDFAYDNPRNPNVKGVGSREIRRLFPTLRGPIRSVTLAPPLTRACAFSPWLLATLEALPFLRTHRVAILCKTP